MKTDEQKFWLTIITIVVLVSIFTSCYGAK